MDGVSFPAECTDERVEQNAYYCGYDCDTMVNNMFAYGPDGKVFFAAINFPGSWADSSFDGSLERPHPPSAGTTQLQRQVDEDRRRAVAGEIARQQGPVSKSERAPGLHVVLPHDDDGGAAGDAGDVGNGRDRERDHDGRQAGPDDGGERPHCP